MTAGQMPAGEALALVPKFKESSEREIVDAALEMAEGMKRIVPGGIETELRSVYARDVRCAVAAARDGTEARRERRRCAFCVRR